MGGIQGNSANALLDILKSRNIPHVFKWVDDVILFRCLSASFLSLGSQQFVYQYDLDTVFGITLPLGVPWHPLSSKGQDFAWTVKYIGFFWDLWNCCMSLPDKKNTPSSWQSWRPFWHWQYHLLPVVTVLHFMVLYNMEHLFTEKAVLLSQPFPTSSPNFQMIMQDTMCPTLFWNVLYGGRMCWPKFEDLSL